MTADCGMKDPSPRMNGMNTDGEFTVKNTGHGAWRRNLIEAGDYPTPHARCNYRLTSFCLKAFATASDLECTSSLR